MQADSELALRIGREETTYIEVSIYTLTPQPSFEISKILHHQFRNRLKVFDESAQLLSVDQVVAKVEGRAQTHMDAAGYGTGSNSAKNLKNNVERCERLGKTSKSNGSGVVT